MSRTDLDAETLARSLRAMAGDGSIEWTYEPVQTNVLLDIADLLDENAKLRRAFNETLIRLVAANDVAVSSYMDDEYLELLRELGIEVE